MTPAVILAFDTSAAHCAAALLSGDRLWQRHEAMEKGQAERLIPLLQDLLAEAGLDWPEVTALAVGTGPGNFTGVRIAVAAARGLALALAVPAIGVTRLEALAEGLPRPVTVAEDARRGEAYVQHFDLAGPGPARLLALAEAQAIPAAPAPVRPCPRVCLPPCPWPRPSPASPPPGCTGRSRARRPSTCAAPTRHHRQTRRR